jgi:hypothetical protein
MPHGPPTLCLPRLVDPEGVANDIANRHAGIERVERILKDHAHLLAIRLHLIVGQGSQIDHFTIMILEQDLTAGQVVGAQNAAAGSCLAAAALPHQAHGFTLQDLEGNIVNRLDMTDRAPEEPGHDWKPLLQIPDIQQDILSSGVAVL